MFFILTNSKVVYILCIKTLVPSSFLGAKNIQGLARVWEGGMGWGGGGRTLGTIYSHFCSPLLLRMTIRHSYLKINYYNYFFWT